MARKQPYSPSCREGFFSESGLPLNIVLGNSEGKRHKQRAKGLTP